MLDEEQRTRRCSMEETESGLSSQRYLPVMFARILCDIAAPHPYDLGYIAIR